MTGLLAGGAHSPIEDYLDEIVRGMQGAPARQLRHLLAEVECHLRDQAAVAVDRGLSEVEAEESAVQAMGPASDLVRSEVQVAQEPVPALIRRAVASGLWLASVGALVVGVSGVTAALVRVLWGASALVDVPPGQVLSAADCSRWLLGASTAGSCRAAAISDWVGEVIGLRLFAGVVGIAGLLAYRTLKRNWTRRGVWAVLPTQVTATIGLVAFGAAAALTLGNGVDLLVIAGGRGSGQWLSAAPVAAVAGLWFALVLARSLRQSHALRSVPDSGQ